MCYIYSGVIVWLRGCGSLLPEIKEGNPSGLPSLSHFCISVNRTPQTYAGRGFEHVVRMIVQTNLPTHALHNGRPTLQPQRYAQLERTFLPVWVSFISL